MKLNKKLLKPEDWKILDVNISPNTEIIIPEITEKSEMWVYFSGLWYQKKVMYLDKDLTTEGVCFDTSDANPSNPQKYGVSASFMTGTVRNDTLSTTNITKLKYR